jgi:FixJ family two-component response regulator
MAAFDDQTGIRERAGCVAFLRKPFPASELLKAINRTLKCGDTAIPENPTTSQN